MLYNVYIRTILPSACPRTEQETNEIGQHTRAKNGRTFQLPCELCALCGLFRYISRRTFGVKKLTDISKNTKYRKWKTNLLRSDTYVTLGNLSFFYSRIRFILYLTANLRCQYIKRQKMAYKWKTINRNGVFDVFSFDGRLMIGSTNCAKCENEQKKARDSKPKQDFGVCFGKV